MAIRQQRPGRLWATHCTRNQLLSFTAVIDGANGRELWAFIPKEHLSTQSKLYFDPSAGFKHYGVDGDIVPVIADRNKNGIIESADGDFVYIIFGMRRGGDSYYALDVTNKNSPVVKWTQTKLLL